MSLTRKGAAGLATLVLCVSMLAGVAWSDPPEPPGQPTDAVVQRGDQFQVKPAGTVDNLNLFFGPYTIGPGQDMNRFDVDLPMRNGYLLSVSPSLRAADNLVEYGHQTAHIHHAHWFKTDIGNLEDNYFSQPGFGTHEWIFGNGDEETKADFQPRTEADPSGPIYGQYLPSGGAGPVIYMIHNKTSQPIVVYIRLKVTFLHGTPEELNAPGHRRRRLGHDDRSQGEEADRVGLEGGRHADRNRWAPAPRRHPHHGREPRLGEAAVRGLRPGRRADDLQLGGGLAQGQVLRGLPDDRDRPALARADSQG
jgi:hypothetical protein